MRRYGMIAAMVMVLLVNGMVVGGVLYNRSGTPEASVELTERELQVDAAHKENSRVSLRLNWNRGGNKDWFDRAKLEELGFDCNRAAREHDAGLFYRQHRERRAYIVLEYEGKAWDGWQNAERRRLEEWRAELAIGKVSVSAVENAEKRLAWDQLGASRLFAVDAGLDPEQLRRRYSDRSRYIITPGLVRMDYQPVVKLKDGSRQPPVFTGSVARILTESIHVPGELQERLVRFRKEGHSFVSYRYGGRDDRPPQPRFAVRVAYGKCLEPWLADVRLIGQTN